jgi:hypothetical protein
MAVGAGFSRHLNGSGRPTSVLAERRQGTPTPPNGYRQLIWTTANPCHAPIHERPPTSLHRHKRETG